MPRPTAADLLRYAEEAEEEARGFELKRLALLEYARQLRAAAESAPLTIGGKRSMVSSNMEASSLAGKPENVRTSANRARRTSKARDAMIASNHVAQNLADACRCGRSTMNAYLNGTRTAPDVVRRKLAKAPYLIPVDSWPEPA